MTHLTESVSFLLCEPKWALSQSVNIFNTHHAQADVSCEGLQVSLPPVISWHDCSLDKITWHKKESIWRYKTAQVGKWLYRQSPSGAEGVMDGGAAACRGRGEDESADFVGRKELFSGRGLAVTHCSACCCFFYRSWRPTSSTAFPFLRPPDVLARTSPSSSPPSFRFQFFLTFPFFLVFLFWHSVEHKAYWMGPPGFHSDALCPDVISIDGVRSGCLCPGPAFCSSQTLGHSFSDQCSFYWLCVKKQSLHQCLY